MPWEMAKRMEKKYDNFNWKPAKLPQMTSGQHGDLSIPACLMIMCFMHMNQIHFGQFTKHRAFFKAYFQILLFAVSQIDKALADNIKFVAPPKDAILRFQYGSASGALHNTRVDRQARSVSASVKQGGSGQTGAKSRWSWALELDNLLFAAKAAEAPSFCIQCPSMLEIHKHDDR